MKLKNHRRRSHSAPKASRRVVYAGVPPLPVKSKSIRIRPAAGSRTALEFHSVTQSIDEGVVISDARGTIIFWNEGAETIFGYAEKEILGKPLALLIPMQSSAFRGGKFEQLLFNKASPIDGKTHELRGIHANGHRFPVELSLLTWTFGNKAFFTTVIRDITERKRLQKEILEISGREQQRIGQDLHDDLCQQLTAITLLSEVLEKKLSDKASPEAADVGEIHTLTAKAIVQTRLLAKGLLPVEVSADGLMSALEAMAANTEKLAHLSCRTEGRAPVLIRDRTAAVHLYRIAQEAITNAVKHARAKHIVIQLSEKNGQIVLSIADDGVGIAPDAIHNGGLGLSIMSSRAETIGGVLQIQPGKEGGTVVTCELPSPVTPLIKSDRPRAVRKGGYGNPSLS
jgi:two-component system, LuxR family, sensor kinase FixL